jgi:hypothetical protein
MILFIPLILFSCAKSTDADVTKLLRTEATDYNGNILYTEYNYDHNERITIIRHAEYNGQPADTITVSYNGNEAILLSFPKDDPVYKKTKEVRLALDANGKMLKRIAYTHGISMLPAVYLTERFIYDTLTAAYDAAGFLKETKEGLYDSTRVDPSYYNVRNLSSTVTYTTISGNVTKSDEFAVYPGIMHQADTNIISGGSSEYHSVFSYTKSFPNKTDFRNAAVLNEYRDYYEAFLDINYKNMTDQVVQSSTDKDINGTIIFSGGSTVDITRSYNTEGLLSEVNILTPATQFRKILYFYGR